MTKITAILAFVLCASMSLGKEAKEPPAADEIVKSLYAAAKGDKSPFFQADDRARLDPYFTKSLGDLLWKDFIDANGEVGALNFDPLFASQDPQPKNFVIGEPGLGGDKKFGPEDEAVVQVTFIDGEQEVMISFRLVQGADKQWRIDDIRYPSINDLLLREILSPEKTEE
jgi:hypothetical protein